MNYIFDVMPWITDHGLKILVIFIVVFIVHKSARVFISKVIEHAVRSHNSSDVQAEEKREKTLVRIFSATASIVVWVIGGLMILQEGGFEIAPLLAAAGIVGIALGFGGQYLIRDVISGLFIILENQYRIGDVVSVEGKSGVVEDITLRMTTLRDMDGIVHYVPHGEISMVSNMSKEFSKINLNIGVSYKDDLDNVIKVVNAVGKGMGEDQVWGEKILKDPAFLRVDDFADSAVVIKIVGEAKASEQWAITGELRKRLKIAFDKEGIEIPFPQVVVHQGV